MIQPADGRVKQNSYYLITLINTHNNSITTFIKQMERENTVVFLIMGTKVVKKKLTHLKGEK